MATAATGTRRALKSAGGDTEAGHVDDLRSLGRDGLASLLALRPDLADPPPSSLDDLEARALTVTSVYRAVMEADTAVVHLVQVFALFDGPHVALADVRPMLGDLPDTELQRLVDWLSVRRLVAPASDASLCVHPAILSAIPTPAGLGPRASSLAERLSADNLRAILQMVERRPAGATRKAALLSAYLAFVSDGEAVRQLVGRAPTGARELAIRASTGSAAIPLPWQVAAYADRPAARSGRTDPVLWLVDHGLAIRQGWNEAVMPREVALALRGGHPFPPASYLRPSAALAELPAPAAPDVEARSTAVVAAVERIVESWGARPAPALKTGGIGVREIRRLAGEVELAERDAFRLVEMSAHAGLVVVDPRRGLALPTPAADEWLELAMAERWWALARSWLDADGHPSLAGALEVRDKVIPALLYTHVIEGAPDQRRSLLKLVVERSQASTDVAPSLAELAHWEAPLAWTGAVASPSLVAGWLLDEMALLGLAVHGAPSALAHALLSGDHATARAAFEGTDAESWRLVLQADLSALVTGRVPHRVRVERDQLADVEGRGPAVQYRFSEASLRRAFDAGRSGEDILGFLAQHAARGVPQALEYLIGDVERRHGHIRVGVASCYVRFDDPVLATEALRSRRSVKLGLFQIAPTVLACSQPPDMVLQALRSDGYLPLAESADGSAVHAVAARERAAVDKRRKSRDGGAVDRPEVNVVALATTLLAQKPTAVRASPKNRLSALPRGPYHIDFRTAVPRHGLTTMDAEIADVTFPDTAEVDLWEVGRWDEEALGDDVEVWDGPAGGHGAARPTQIVHDRGGIIDLLRTAGSEDWLVRISYTAGSGRTSEVTIDVLDVSASSVLAQAAPRWTDQRYVLDRIGWVRVLTEAEEDLA